MTYKDQFYCDHKFYHINDFCCYGTVRAWFITTSWRWHRSKYVVCSWLTVCLSVCLSVSLTANLCLCQLSLFRRLPKLWLVHEDETPVRRLNHFYDFIHTLVFSLQLWANNTTVSPRHCFTHYLSLPSFLTFKQSVKADIPFNYFFICPLCY
jgi:hypothetical protein